MNSQKLMVSKKGQPSQQWTKLVFPLSPLFGSSTVLLKNTFVRYVGIKAEYMLKQRHCCFKSLILFYSLFNHIHITKHDNVICPPHTS